MHTCYGVERRGPVHGTAASAPPPLDARRTCSLFETEMSPFPGRLCAGPTATARFVRCIAPSFTLALLFQRPRPDVPRCWRAAADARACTTTPNKSIIMHLARRLPGSSPVPCSLIPSPQRTTTMHLPPHTAGDRRKDPGREHGRELPHSAMSRTSARGPPPHTPSNHRLAAQHAKRARAARRRVASTIPPTTTTGPRNHTVRARRVFAFFPNRVDMF